MVACNNFFLILVEEEAYAKAKALEVPSLHAPDASSNDDTLNDVDPLDIDGENDEKQNDRRRSSTSLESNNTTPAKKVRKKPEPKIVENMKEYFDNDTLNQLTTTTLRHWLKQQQVHCTTREKKSDLMEKVQKHFLKND
ncbi:hypothetical protein RN001_008193 [Aquatica leii]|uniref:Uncharacterized protein n=1 Tax=Aquatica leii TaxID=1421715 RepID=A0AAN7P9D1_9COLE|nr:hypothetical protein RN001_008193 [Aquatica leii]